MNGYEKIVSLIKNSKSNFLLPFALGEMKSNTVCLINRLELEPDDYLISDHIKDKLKEGDIVLVLRYSDDTYILLERLVKV